MNTQPYNSKEDIKQLNSFLQDELAAVETYHQCIEKVDDAKISSSLANLQQSHQLRVDKLRHRIEQLGGTPEDSSGAWGAVAKLFEGSAKLFGDKSAVSALEEGEDRGQTNYQKKVSDLAPENQSFINAEVLPEHQRSHAMLNSVRDMVH